MPPYAIDEDRVLLALRRSLDRIGFAVIMCDIASAAPRPFSAEEAHRLVQRVRQFGRPCRLVLTTQDNVITARTLIATVDEDALEERVSRLVASGAAFSEELVEDAASDGDEDDGEMFALVIEE